jgi:hypothetical protein
VFSGDLVYVDRLLGILPGSSVRNGRKAFQALDALRPERIVPGHGRVCDLAQAKREAGDYYDFLAEKVGTAAKEMEPMDATLDRCADLPQFRHLENVSVRRTTSSAALAGSGKITPGSTARGVEHVGRWNPTQTVAGPVACSGVGLRGR